MSTYKDLFELHLKYIEFLLSKSQFTHQYAKNISASGGDTEFEIRKMFAKLLPRRFKVTHGYIARAENNNTTPNISPQIDLIIVDTLVSHSLFAIDELGGLEIVPVESVVGIFEIKRTINRESILGTKKNKGALEHLENICHAVGITKAESETYLPGGLKLGGALFNNPILGIVGLSHSKVLINGKNKNTLKDLILKSKFKPPIDIIGSFGGFMYATIENKEPFSWTPHNVRLPETVITYAVLHKANHPVAQIISKIFGFVLAYLVGVTGRNCQVGSYYFNNFKE